MGWSAILFGELTLPSTKVPAWQKSALDAGKLRGDLGVAAELVYIARPVSVAEAIARLPAAGVDFVRFEEQDGRVTLRGHLDEGAFGESVTELAAIAAAAGAHGAKGQLAFSSEEHDFLTTVKIDGARVAITAVTGHKNPTGLRAIHKARQSEGYRAVLATLREKLGVPAARAASRLGAGDAQVLADALAAIRDLDAAVFKAALAQTDNVFIDVRPGMKGAQATTASLQPLAKLGSTQKTIVAYLDQPFAPCLAACLRLLYIAASAQAHPLATRVGQPVVPDLTLAVTMVLATPPDVDPGAHTLAELEAAAKKLRARGMAFNDPAASSARVLINKLGQLRYAPARRTLSALKKFPQLRAFCESALKLIGKKP